MTNTFTRSLRIPKENLIICKATSGSRIGAKLIDGIVEIIILVSLVLLFIGTYRSSSEADALKLINILAVTYQVIALFLNLLLPAITKGQTVGKMLLGIRIIHIDGNVGNIIVFLIRQSFFSVIVLIGQIPILTDFMNTALFIVYLVCFIGLFSDDYGRTLQDYFAKTIVVNDSIWKKYRERAFFEIDNPTSEIDESNEEDVLYEEFALEPEELTPNQSINSEEEIL